MAKILVADDDIHIRGLIKLILNEHQIIEASDGTDAVTKFISTKPDLVLLDVIMPKMNGVEACKKIRALPEGKTAKILMMSAKTIVEMKEVEAVEADDLITKPFKPQDLKKKVQEFLS